MRWMFLAVLVLCGCDDDGGGGATCESRCASRINACNLQVGDVAAYCADDFCPGKSAEVIDCYERASCDALRNGTHGCESGGTCPELSCDCNGQPVNGQVQIGGRCAQSCQEVCAALAGAMGS